MHRVRLKQSQARIERANDLSEPSEKLRVERSLERSGAPRSDPNDEVSGAPRSVKKGYVMSRLCRSSDFTTRISESSPNRRSKTRWSVGLLDV